MLITPAEPTVMCLHSEHQKSVPLSGATPAVPKKGTNTNSDLVKYLNLCLNSTAANRLEPWIKNLAQMEEYRSFHEKSDWTSSWSKPTWDCGQTDGNPSAHQKWKSPFLIPTGKHRDQEEAWNFSAPFCHRVSSSCCKLWTWELIVVKYGMSFWVKCTLVMDH